MKSKVVLHLSHRFSDTFNHQPHLGLHVRIQDLVAARGGTIEVRSRDERLRDPHRTDWSNLLESDCLHIIENGLVHQPGVLNTTLAYLPPFYHLDPRGVLAQSSAGDACFDPSAIEGEKAQKLWDDLQSRFVEKRWSRYNQPKERKNIPQGCVAIFLQGDTPQRWATAHCSPEVMIRSVAAQAQDRPVVIKAHPTFNPKAEQRMIHALQTEGLKLVPTQANIHDILAACAVTVSFNSAVALEGFLHHKPAILFGKSDVHHVCETVTDPKKFTDHLTLALSANHDYQRYLYWYFSTFCLSLDSADLDKKILTSFANQGFSAGRLGMRSGPWKFEQATNALEASKALTRYLQGRPDIRSIRITEALKFKPDSWVFAAKLNDEKVVIKRFFNEDRAHTVRSVRGELSQLENTFGDGDCQANRCLMAWPEDGIAILSFAPGPRLDKKIASALGQSRQKLLQHAGRWLSNYPGARQRSSTFGPGYWIKRCLARDHEAIAPEDLALLDQLVFALRTQNDRVKGCPVIQAASHGDFVGMNAHYHRGTVYGVDIQGEHWCALAREVARFLVWQQIHDDTRPADLTHGLATKDVQAFLSSGVLPESEHITTFPFFVGEQLYGRFVEDYRRPDIRANTRAAIEGYLRQHTN